MPTISPISWVSATESPQVESSCLREFTGQCWGWSRFGVERKCNERAVREESLERKKRTEWSHLATNRKEFSCFACKLSQPPTWRITTGTTASNERVYLIGSQISKHQSHQGLCCSQILPKACVCCMCDDSRAASTHFERDRWKVMIHYHWNFSQTPSFFSNTVSFDDRKTL